MVSKTTKQNKKGRGRGGGEKDAGGNQIINYAGKCINKQLLHLDAGRLTEGLTEGKGHETVHMFRALFLLPASQHLTDTS